MKQPEGKKRPVLLFMKNTMPKTTTYKEGEKFVAISELPNTSNNVINMKKISANNSKLAKQHQLIISLLFGEISQGHLECVGLCSLVGDVAPRA